MTDFPEKVFITIWMFSAWFISSRVSAAIEERAREHARHERTDSRLSAADRVSHIAADSDTAARQNRDIQVFWALLSLVVIPLWIQALSVGASRTEQLVYSTVTVLVVLFSVSTVRAVRRQHAREVHRIRIRRLLREERSRWDPLDNNPKIFVIHRDTVPMAVTFFEAISSVCADVRRRLAPAFIFAAASRIMASSTMAYRV